MSLISPVSDVNIMAYWNVRVGVVTVRTSPKWILIMEANPKIFKHFKGSFGPFLLFFIKRSDGGFKWCKYMNWTHESDVQWCGANPDRCACPPPVSGLWGSGSNTSHAPLSSHGYSLHSHCGSLLCLHSAEHTTTSTTFSPQCWLCIKSKKIKKET